ncbi:tRNA uridine(34) 5-carboxymethylaminomethyl modification radical SAM/GNAT enzyme Elp3 [Candidatus Pacearchaeota archaeon]|jgi:elongator complex protein 3|nr:tRNA uridine(34) 5-carboxymethylaminomethyl modification radical SAM/GNAT enzyme Elp3 [Candidatus Pacearchaeota archaeon]
MKIPKQGEVRKPTKTISGITPVAVMLPPRKCNHGACVYCPSMDVPQSYTPRSPVVMRARRVGYDAYRQVRERLKAFRVMNHPTDKIEVVIMGGTFLEYDKKFQESFIKGIYDGLNGKRAQTLKQAQKMNESAGSRCVALCVETRPDVCIDFIGRMRGWGVTRVELGAQIIDDKIYGIINRGHKVQDVIDATRALKNAGFKIGYHIMPGLPGSSLKKDYKLFNKFFSSSDFRPDQLKIYPCQVMPNSKLEKLYWKGTYKPYTRRETEKILTAMLKKVPRYCRVMRIMREIPPQYIVAGTRRIDLRQEIEKELRKKDSRLKEIRYREVGFVLEGGDVDDNLKLKVTRYKASGGTEYFLEIVNNDDILFGLCRLRICGIQKSHKTSQTSPPKLLNKNFQDNNVSVERAIIRELHVYGPALRLGAKGKISQHRGFGKWLMEKAEGIVIKEGIKKLRVISGIGVHEYYKKLDYKLEKGKGGYMVKFL